jgi:hypothetical protein
MQGHWRDVADGSALRVEGFDVIHRGVAVAHDFFTLDEREGALNAVLGVDDPAREDAFQRENLTGLVIDPEGQFQGWNTRFGATFERAEA